MATHSSVLAWRIPWTEEPGGLQAIGLWRLWYDWSDLACTHKVAGVDFLPFWGEKKQYLAGLLGPISCHSNIQMYRVERCPSMPPIPSPPSLSPRYSSFLPPAFLLLLFPSSSSPPPPLPPFSSSLLTLLPPLPQRQELNKEGRWGRPGISGCFELSDLPMQLAEPWLRRISS